MLVALSHMRGVCVCVCREADEPMLRPSSLEPLASFCVVLRPVHVVDIQAQFYVRTSTEMNAASAMLINDDPCRAMHLGS